MASSILLPGERIINDGTGINYWDAPEGYATGLRLEGRKTPFGQMRGASPFPDELLIPRSEWQARIQEMEERKSRHSDIVIQAGLPCKDQARTNYCWANAPVYCVEAQRVIQNQPMVILSPASIAAPIKQFQNEGGWGEEALNYMIDNGVCPASLWPANAIDRRYLTAANKAAAKDYMVSEWWELVPRNLDQLISCLLRRVPIAVGYNWWRHEVTACDPVWIDGDIGVRIRNNWGMNWGSQGFAVLQGRRMLPDDAVGPRQLLAA